MVLDEEHRGECGHDSRNGRGKSAERKIAAKGRWWADDICVRCETVSRAETQASMQLWRS